MRSDFSKNKFTGNIKISAGWILFILITSVFLFNSIVLCHRVKPPLIIDTDSALDDMRSITMLLNTDSFNILLIAVSDGSASPERGAKTVADLLSYFDRGDIPVHFGRKLDKAAPPWRKISESINTDTKRGLNPSGLIKPKPDAAKKIIEILRKSKSKVVYLCIGPLTNLADAMKIDPSIAGRIEKIVYYGVIDGDGDFNTGYDPESARAVASLDIPLYAITAGTKKFIPLDSALIDKIQSQGSPAAELIARVQSKATADIGIKDHKFGIWDELAVIYLFNPSLFNTRKAAKNRFKSEPLDNNGIIDLYLDLLSNPADRGLSPRESTMFRNFPVDPVLLAEGIAPYAGDIINKYGLEEWKACFITNELHRHLGFYSIIGAKMGVRARELLQTPFDELEVISFAGNEPPLSCMNDGLQVSTGASLGRGNISIDKDHKEPSALFMYKNKKLILRLKHEIVQQIKKEIDLISRSEGFQTPAYFRKLSRISIDYWLKLNRKQIFEEIFPDREEK